MAAEALAAGALRFPFVDGAASGTDGTCPNRASGTYPALRTARTQRIAHLSDVHMLPATERARRKRPDLSVRFLSFGRSLDAVGRRRKLARALDAARRMAASHVVISGDLTEIGATEEFETFAEVLHESRWAPEQVTLVPGNHDAYTHPDGWKRALEGPLRDFRVASAEQPGKVVEVAGVNLLPVDVACHQPITRSAGELTADTAEVLETRLRDAGLRGAPLVLVQHHPPFAHTLRAWQWIDGLRGWERVMGLLERYQGVHVLHGHLHHAVDRIVGDGRSRSFGAPATVDDDHAAARLRFYDVRDGKLTSAGIVEA